MLSILLEQSQDIAAEFKRLGKQASVLLVCWLFLTFLVGNAYKGVLFTLLTSPSVPFVPRTLQQMIQSNYSVVTTQGEMLFTLHLFIKNAKQAPVTRINISSALNLYRKLWNRTDLVFTTTSKLFVDTKFLNKNSVSKDLMVLNPEKNMILLKDLNTLFTQNIVAFGEKLNFFSDRKLWVFRRNGFLTVILTIQTGLMESGIYKRWEYFSKVLSTYWELLETQTKLNKDFEVSKRQFF